MHNKCLLRAGERVERGTSGLAFYSWNSLEAKKMIKLRDSWIIVNKMSSTQLLIFSLSVCQSCLWLSTCTFSGMQTTYQPNLDTHIRWRIIKLIVVYRLDGICGILLWFHNWKGNKIFWNSVKIFCHEYSMSCWL